MRFAILSVPALALMADAAAVHSNSTATVTTKGLSSSAHVTTKAPLASSEPTHHTSVGKGHTLDNRPKAVQSVLSAMASSWAKKHPHKTTISVKRASARATQSSTKPSATGKAAKSPAASSSKSAQRAAPSGKPAASPSSKPLNSSPHPSTSITTSSTTKPTAKPKVRRDEPAACIKQPVAYTNTTTLSSGSSDILAPLQSFLQNTSMSATSLIALSPPNYIPIYTGLLSTAQKASMYYITYTDMPSYSPAACAAVCDAMSGNLCRSFSIYFERSPSVWPGVGCKNPAAFTSVKCAYYSTKIKAADASNAGQWRADFGVVVSGANAYNRVFSL